MSNRRLGISLSLFVLLLAACNTNYPETCPSSTPVGLLNASEIAADDSLPFQFPLEESAIDEKRYFGWFGVSNECRPDTPECYEFPEVKFHAAEDYQRPAGTPVYAIADGVINYSGRARGYGWLILIDHPQANLYSLYGHLSPSRWKLEKGTVVKRGDLIAYLGDSDENGGSVEQPLDPHLHFGIRAGQIADYPTKGEWRYHGGWIKLCPQDVGWLQPSLVITNQEIPPGGFSQPEVRFWTLWGFELGYTILCLIFGINMTIRVSQQENRFLILIPGLFITFAALVLRYNKVARTYVLLVIGIVILAVDIFYFLRHPISKKHIQS